MPSRHRVAVSILLTAWLNLNEGFKRAAYWQGKGGRLYPLIIDGIESMQPLHPSGGEFTGQVVEMGVYFRAISCRRSSSQPLISQNSVQRAATVLGSFPKEDRWS
ncbi:hypothetical protein BDN71DRAFT_1443958 [Pleurotus eryngii]|uniref:Uncharacterized protein n=1 Tax=Pleurotus eryngii TaxID=5323 RepID=A0A9P6DI14_PLEER|nr:hypothetical protein BDN71DRAFT_1443958 [Pleurotus eryngii]